MSDVQRYRFAGITPPAVEAKSGPWVTYADHVEALREAREECDRLAVSGMRAERRAVRDDIIDSVLSLIATERSVCDSGYLIGALDILSEKVAAIKGDGA